MIAALLRLPNVLAALAFAGVYFISPPQIADVVRTFALGDEIAPWIWSAGPVLIAAVLNLFLWAPTKVIDPKQLIVPAIDAGLAALPAILAGAILLGPLDVIIALLPISLTALLCFFLISRALLRLSDQRRFNLAMLAGVVALCGLATAIAMTLLQPVDVPIAVSPMGLIAVAFAVWSLAFTALMRFPIATLLGFKAACILVAFFYMGPGQDIAVAKSQRDPLPFFDGFYDWLTSRDDLAAYEDENLPYPVFITAAEGGGIYAMVHSYLALKAIEGTCGSFRQHLFASVGVSGGALGSTLFASEPGGDQLQRPVSCHQNATSANLEPLWQDFLSPPLANLLFAQPFELMMPLSQGIPDGGSALVAAIKDQFPNLPALGGGLTRWNPKGSDPLLVLVSTDVSRGKRFVMSGLGGAGASDEIDSESYPGEFSDVDIDAITAAVVSARFPWFTGTARLPVEGEYRFLADGGYSDNSGANTALDLARAIEEIEELSVRAPRSYYVNDQDVTVCKVRVATRFEKLRREGCDHWVYLVLVPIFASSDTLVDGNVEAAQSYVGDPLNTVLSSMTIQAKSALLEARRFFSSRTGTLLQEGVYPHVLPIDALRLPLGWKLGRSAVEDIWNLAGTTGACDVLASKRGSTVQGPPEGMGAGLDVSLAALHEIRRQNGCSVAALARLFYPKPQPKGRGYWITGR